MLRRMILVTLTIQALRSSETSVPTRATLSYIPEDDIIHSHRRDNFKSYKAPTINFSWHINVLFQVAYCKISIMLKL
jgi:hypothetical protein